MMKAKRPSVSARIGVDNDHMRPFYKAYTDTCGPFMAAYNGCRYLQVHTCASTRLRVGFAMARRVEVTATLKQLDVMLRGQLCKAGYVLAKGESAMCILQADNAQEFQEGDFKNLCNDMQISLCRSSPYFHENLSMVERMRGLIFNIVRPLLHQAGFPKCLWPFAADHAIFVNNRLPAKSNDFKSSFGLFYGEEADLSRIKVFGCDCYAFEEEDCRQDKISPRALKFTFVGNVVNSTAYKLVDSRNNLLRYTTGVW